MAKQGTRKQLTPKQMALALALCLAIAAFQWYFRPEPASLENIPEWSGAAYVELEDNQPGFTKEEMTLEVFELYSDLDGLGRCGAAYANICPELMPTEDRGSIGNVKPTGWVSAKYDCVDGKYLYNRCHLIGFQLAGENANEKNLITGTRYLNVTGMLPFENDVADYVQRTDNHVLYRVTPVFVGNELVARGVQMEAYSVEDAGDGVCFNIFAYNVQPGVVIDYATGESWLEEDAA
nr:DNA/RNA non-specific endonuclease [uncultured Oscillibacter sp.]